MAEGVAHSLPDAAKLADVFIDVCDGCAPHGQVYDFGNGEEANGHGHQGKAVEEIDRVEGIPRHGADGRPPNGRQEEPEET